MNFRITSFLWFCIFLVSLVQLGHCALKKISVTTYPMIGPTKNASKILNIGGIGTFTGGGASGPGLMRFMVEQINQDTTILPDVLIQLYKVEGNSSEANVLRGTETLIEEYNVSALVGGFGSDETGVIQLVASIYDVPQICSSPSSPSLSNKVTYPFLARVSPPSQYQNLALISLLQAYDWHQAVVTYTDDDYGSAGLGDLQKATVGLNISLHTVQIHVGTKNFSVYVDEIVQHITSKRNRIFIMYTQPAEGMGLMSALNDRGLVGNTTNNVYIMLGAITGPFRNSPAYNTKIYPFMQGAVGLSPRGVVPTAYALDLQNKWINANRTLFPGTRPDPGTSWYWVDAVRAIAEAADKLIKSGTPLESITGPQLFDTIKTNTFNGVSGLVVLDSNCDREGDYAWFNFGPYGTNFTYAAIYQALNQTTMFFFNNQNLTFYGAAFPVDGLCTCYNGACDVKDVCICKPKWSGPTCNIYLDQGGFSTNQYIMAVVIPVFIVAILVGAIFKFFRYKRSRMIKDMAERQRSVIKREDISLKERIGRGAAGEVFRGMFRGTEVAVKKLLLNGSTSQDTIQEFELECAIMTGLRHPNIVMFMGMCIVQESKEMLLVMELMERGSLHDVLHNPKMQLSQSLCLHIAYQAAKGMNFLHQSDPPIIHRDLKSHNILMDDKWNTKISDFGITKFKQVKKSQKDTKESSGKSNSLGTIYWTGPEVFLGNLHSEPSDVYSFGIVLWELFHRKTPYDGREPMAVAVEVPNNLRPIISPNIDPELSQLMRECWDGNPVKRPTFEVVMNRLKSMNLQNPNLNYGIQETSQTEAPTGMVYLVHTDVRNAEQLWDSIPMTMLDAMVLHNQLLRSTLETCDGYEIEYTENSFFAAFNNLKDAVNWCIATQLGLLHIKWPQELLDHAGANTVQVNGKTIWSGLRVCMSIHTGVPNCENDISSGRMTYSGPVADRARKLVSSADGTIIVSSAVMEKINTKGEKFMEDLSAVSCGEVVGTARDGVDKIYDLVPNSLSVRQHRLDRETPGGDLPNSLMDIEEFDINQNLMKAISMKHAKLPWNVVRSEMEERNSVGRGPIGEYVRTMWAGTEVVQKVLLNQQLGEADVLTLKARASVLTKLKHKNLLEFYGVCLEHDHISLLVEYLPNSGLPALLADNSVNLSFRQKLKIAKQTAEAMEFLSNQRNNDWLSINGNLKSANVLVSRDSMEVKVSDYGQGNLKDLARTMTSVGTVAWTAPELLNGDAVTPKISVYSFGIIMWEIYTRMSPYRDEHPIRVVAKIQTGYRPSIPGDCPAAYSQLMVQCWDANPEDRPGWGQIVSTLESIVA